jgi:non-ribosomal peptide synthetase component E (peptide arylation enzyme)
MPGFEMAILDDDLKVQPANTPGVLAVNIANSPMYTFTGFSKAETQNVRGGWYITGDTMMRNEDSYFSFVGRNVREALLENAECDRGHSTPMQTPMIDVICGASRSIDVD